MTWYRLANPSIHLDSISTATHCSCVLMFSPFVIARFYIILSFHCLSHQNIYIDSISLYECSGLLYYYKHVFTLRVHLKFKLNAKRLGVVFSVM